MYVIDILPRHVIDILPRHPTPTDCALPRSPMQADLSLLCPAGGCAPIDQAETCNIGVVAAHALMGRAEFKTSAEGKAMVAALIKAGAAATTGFLSAAKTLGGKSTSQLFQASTTELKVGGSSSGLLLLLLLVITALATV